MQEKIHHKGEKIHQKWKKKNEREREREREKEITFYVWENYV